MFEIREGKIGEGPENALGGSRPVKKEWGQQRS